MITWIFCSDTETGAVTSLGRGAETLTALKILLLSLIADVKQSWVFLGAFFPLFPIEIAVRFAVAASSQNYEFWGSISSSYLSYLWRMKLLINQRFICGVFFELLHENHQRSDNFAAFWTFISHICHIHFATREFWRVFFLFYSSWTLQDVSPRLRDSILSYFNSCHKP